MTRSSDNPWLCRFAGVTAVTSLLLICVGGLVTSHEAGMSVPDWPTTYGYNMFFFPISQWTGGIFYEHTHRLIASAVGLLTIALAVWLWLKESRSWLRWLGVIAVILVTLQGVLGGLRVTEMMSELGIVHATLAQLFLVLISGIVLFTSRAWRDFPLPGNETELRSLNRLFVWATGLVLLQLMVAATMRHQHAGLAIPDFPLAYGKLWPATDPEAVARYNQMRTEVMALNPITAFQVNLHMVHRLLAFLVLASICTAVAAARRRLGRKDSITRLSWVWLAMILAQIGLGAATIWTNKSADIATLHVAVGSLSLATGALLCLRARRQLAIGTNKAAESLDPLGRTGQSPAPAGNAA